MQKASQEAGKQRGYPLGFGSGGHCGPHFTDRWGEKFSHQPHQPSLSRLFLFHLILTIPDEIYVTRFADEETGSEAFRNLVSLQSWDRVGMSFQWIPKLGLNPDAVDQNVETEWFRGQAV